MPYELLLTDVRLIKQLKTELEEENKLVKPIFQDGSHKIIKTTIKETTDPFLLKHPDLKFRNYNASEADNQSNEMSILSFTKSFLETYNVKNIDEFISHLPLRYTIYTPLLLFNYSKERSFNSEPWLRFFDSPDAGVKEKYFKELLSKVFPTSKLTHVAINMPIIEADIMRRPFNIYPLYGELISPDLDLTKDQLWDSPSETDFNNTLWCHTIQNGIHQFWAPLFTMFSRGNIKEKKRILDTFQDIEGNDVIDMYAGIGYFTLSYLKKKARRVYCFELNPWSVKGLEKGIKANKIERHRCQIFNESNENCISRIKETGFQNLRIRHINLGLLPTSQPSWPFCLEMIALQHKYNPINVVSIHIHENIHSDRLDDGSFEEQTLESLIKLNNEFHYEAVHLEKIKTFAPDIWHICLDVNVTCLKYEF